MPGKNISNLNLRNEQLFKFKSTVESPLVYLHDLLKQQVHLKSPKSIKKVESFSLKELNMSHTVFVPKLKHQQLSRIAISKDQNEKKKIFEENLKFTKNYFNQHRWWFIANEKMILDRDTSLLWENIRLSALEHVDNNQAKASARNKMIANLSDWSLPSVDNLKKILEDNSNFPLRSTTYKKILDNSLVCSTKQQMWLDRDYPNLTDSDGLLLVVNKYWVNESILQKFIDCKINQWDMVPYKVSVKDKGYQFFLGCVEEIVDYKINYDQSEDQVPLQQVWKDIDFISTRLPQIESLRFTDIEQGMWEFYVANQVQQENYQKIESDVFIRARNPELDIRNAKVAIDFGTSSTVVAIRTNGRDELLRIGLQEQDLKKHTISDNDFENPTILEFKDILELLHAWESEAYRPLIDWNTVLCSHEARTRFRENDTDTKIVGSIFARLKQWALRDIDEARVRITDQKKHEYEFKPLQELNPIKGQPLNIQNEYPQLDPIELYAWFLGMNINWRERGIYLKYYMTFPVAYPNEVKEKILASFRRGFQRSLPESLVYSERFNEFSVEELESEPAAFAASALNALKIEPTQDGTAYAVFDFGGGTTDFDYGIYRLPNDQEFDEGWDDIIEHFGASGDRFLGGENLLENLAYLVFKNNQNECRDKNISFTKPLDAEAFVGSERLISKTQAAYTNTTLLMSKLRPLWEGGEIIFNGENDVTSLTLLNRDGERVECEIKIPVSALMLWLQERIRDGLRNFFTALKSSFEQERGRLPQEIHILLAGNSSRSRIVLGLLGCLEDDEGEELHQALLSDLSEIFDTDIPEFEIHLPLQADESNPYAPTTKTGVALGLLRVSPGETLKVVNHAHKLNSDSPFQYYVGTHRRNIFSVGLKRGDTYGEWAELGAIRGGIFPLLYTTQPQALNSIERGTNGLVEQNIEFSGSDIQGKKVFAKIITPDAIEIGLSSTIDSVEQQITHRRTVQLKN